MRCLSKIMYTAAAVTLLMQTDIYADKTVISDIGKTVFYNTEVISDIAEAPDGVAVTKDGYLIISPQTGGQVTLDCGSVINICAAKEAVITDGMAVVEFEDSTFDSGQLSLTFSYTKEDVLKENLLLVKDSNSQQIFQILAAKKSTDSVYFGYKSGENPIVSLKTKYVNVNEEIDYSIEIDLDNNAVSLYAGDEEIFSGAPIELQPGSSIGAVNFAEKADNIKIRNAQDLENPEIKINAAEIFKDENHAVKADTQSSIFFGGEWHPIDDKYITVTTDSDGVLISDNGIYVPPTYSADTISIKCGINISDEEYTAGATLNVVNGSSSTIVETAYARLYTTGGRLKLDIFNNDGEKTVFAYVCVYDGNMLSDFNAYKICLKEKDITRTDIDLTYGENESVAVLIPGIDYIQRME